MKLYSAWSIVDNCRGYDKVMFNWIRADRRRPLAPYKQLIDDYKHLDCLFKPYMENYVDELFTGEEINALRDYLWKRSPTDTHFRCSNHHKSQQIDLHVADLALPIGEPIKDENVILRGAFHTGGWKEGYGFSNEEGYDLPFKAWAYVDFQDCPLTSSPSGLRDDTPF